HTWSGTTPPYFVTFQSIDFGRTKVMPTFVSATELRAVVPGSAASGTIVLAARTTSGQLGTTISETTERLLVVQPAPPAQGIPQAGQAPATANTGTLHVQASDQSVFQAGNFAASGAANQIGAFFDANANHLVDLVPGGRNDVPYLAFPERTSE